MITMSTAYICLEGTADYVIELGVIIFKHETKSITFAKVFYQRSPPSLMFTTGQQLAHGLMEYEHLAKSLPVIKCSLACMIFNHSVTQVCTDRVEVEHLVRSVGFQLSVKVLPDFTPQEKMSSSAYQTARVLQLTKAKIGNTRCCYHRFPVAMSSDMDYNFFLPSCAFYAALALCFREL